MTAYLRVSTIGQVNDGLGLSTQERLIKVWAKANGHKIVSVHRDEGVSGANGISDRDGLPLALADVEDGRADAVIISSIDRLARLLHVQEAILGMIWKLDSKLYTVDGGEVLPDDPDDPMRKAMRQMAGVFAELDRAMVIKRLRNGRQTKADNGGYAGGAPSYGMRAEGKALIEDDAEQVSIMRIDELHAEGASLRQIVTTLTAEGIKPKRGNTWYPATVSRVIARQAASNLCLAA